MTTTTPAIADPFLPAQGDGEPDGRLVRWRTWFLILLAAGVVAWAVLAFLIGPTVIRSGYAKTNPIGAINGAFDGREDYALDHYLDKWRKITLAGLVAWLGFGALVLFTTSRSFARRFVGTATPGTLGAIRMFTCLVLVYAAWREPLTSVVQMSARDRVSMGVMDFIYADGAHGRGLPLGFDRLVRSESGLLAYQWLTIGVLLFAALGWKTRTTLIAGGLLILPLLGVVRSYSWLSHQGLLPLYFLFVLIVTRSGDGWSIDRLRKVWRDDPVPPADVPTTHYAWARYAIWTIFVIQYVAAGLSKLFNESWRWWEGRNLQMILYRDALRPGHDPAQDIILNMTWLPAWAYTVAGVSTLVVELGIALALVSWVARVIFPLMALGMHVGIRYFQYILFWDYMLLLVVFYDWRAVRRWLGRRIAARAGSIDVLYDGQCVICRRSVRLMKGWDLLERLNYLDFRTLDVAAYNGHRGMMLDRRALETAMHVVSRGRVTSGFAGCRTIATALPIFWIVAPLLYLPGLSHLGAAGYRWLARNRMAFHTCDAGGACALPSHDSGATPRTSTNSVEAPGATNPANLADRPNLPLARRLLAPLCIVGIICFLLGGWLVRVEWYPFTSVQMFSSYDDSGKISYYKCYATDTFGHTYEAPLESMGRGTKRYRMILTEGFRNDAGRKKCTEMLEFCGAYHNTANAQNPVVKLEVVKRVWDFVNHRRDPKFGVVLDHITVTFPQVDAQSAAASNTSLSR